MKLPGRPDGPRGFTLIEVIVSLVVVGIMGSMLVTFMGNAVQQAADRVLFTKVVCSANTKAQEVVLAFLESYLGETDGLSSFKADVSSGTYDGGGNTVTSDWVRLDGTQITTQGAGVASGYLKVTVTPQSGTPLFFLLTL